MHALTRCPSAAITLALAGCVSPAAPPPAPAIVVQVPEVSPQIVGEWTAAAIDGVPTGFHDRFALTVTAAMVEVLLCNSLGGPYRLDGPRLDWTGPWRSTERGCFDPSGKRDAMATEERVFAMFRSGLIATTPTPDTLRLSGPRGSIDFARGSPRSRAIVGEWSAVAIGGRPLAGADRFDLSVTPSRISTTGLCDNLGGHYRVAQGRVEPHGPPWPRSQRGCPGPALQRIDDRAWAVLGWSPGISLPDEDRMRLTGPLGTIDFERRR